MLDETNGKKGRPYFPFIFSLFIFVLMGNLLGMFPFCFTFTSQLVVTFALASLVFIVVTIVGILKHRGKFLSIFFPDGAPLFMAPVLIPIELLSYLSRPVSLSVRLFANMMAGHTMLKVFAGFTVSLGLWGIFPVAMNVLLTAFEFLVAVLQAYVFTILTCLYFHDALCLHHE
jgi:F-type H+-transporting ATPase subunit a